MKAPFEDQDFEAIRKKAYALRHNYFDDMEKHLLNLEASLQQKGLNVHWIKDQSSLTESINALIQSYNVRRISFDSKIPFEPVFQNRMEVVPLETEENSSDDLDLLVVDADLAVCDTGSLVFLDRKSQCCFNKVKNMAVIVNIDQCLASMQDLSFFLALKYASKEQIMPTDIKILQQQPNYVLPSDLSYLSDQMFTQEPMNVHVILYMNDIEDILTSEILKESLYCIQCGRCLEVCPVAASHDNLSPIELVKINSLDKYNKAQHLFSHTTLCGACEDACPVKIPLIRLMLSEMQVSNMVVKPSRTKMLYSLFSKRSKLNKVNNSFFKFFFIRRFFGRNKNLSRYFSNQNSDFFNITYEPPYEDNPNELIKD
ncbi:MAG: lactate utilization protein [Bacteroidales bacterium]|nr:lactate utilization protein [Bacteroidales bacterium]